MRCGLLKLSRLLREARSDRRPLCGTAVPGRMHSEPRPRRRPAGEHPSTSAEGEREGASWTVPVDNFS
jgi:hypothetical protein